LQIIDSHLHIEALNYHDLEAMALAGVKAIISHTSQPGVHRDIPAQAIFDFADSVLGFHSWRASQFFIETYFCIGVSMVGVPIDYKLALEKLPSYFNKDRIIGIGEIGFEPSSTTCPDLCQQEEILLAQLNMAKEFNKPVTLHTPLTEKPKWVKRYLAMVKEVGLKPDQVIIDHADETIVKMITESGCNAAITVQPWRKVRPADAAKAVQSGDIGLLLIDSDCSTLDSDPLSVPKTVLEMRKLAMPEGTVNKVVWDNPRRIYKLV